MKAKIILSFLVVIFIEVLVNIAVSVMSPGGGFQGVAISAIVGILAGSGVGIFIAGSLTRELRRLTAVATEVSGGDLTKSIQPGGSDEVHQLGEAFRSMVDQLREIVGNVKTTAAQVSQSAQGLSGSAQEMSSSAQEIAGATEHVAKGAEYQAEFVEKSAGRIRSMATSIELIATRAQEAAKASADAGYTAKHGGEATGAALENMREVFERMEAAASAVKGFSERLQRIEKIVEVITGISQQTNLLALNATIEAARAGDYGKGFAVVADEVRKLSEKARRSAGEITDIIREVSRESQDVVFTMTQASAGIASGREVVNTVGRSLKEIIDVTVESASKVREISALGTEQARGAEEMVRTMEEISKIAEDNAAATEEASAATQELTASMEEMAQSATELQKASADLGSSIARFKV